MRNKGEEMKDNRNFNKNQNTKRDLKKNFRKKEAREEIFLPFCFLPSRLADL